MKKNFKRANRLNQTLFLHFDVEHLRILYSTRQRCDALFATSSKFFCVRFTRLISVYHLCIPTSFLSLPFQPDTGATHAATSSFRL